MGDFDHLLNWKLKRGSHEFPGLDGGTCINEAALVAAGFEYQRIGIVEQMPKCFSRPICRLAMMLNDLASDEDRQRLLPYVTRLACADTKQIEKARAAYIERHMGPKYPYYVELHMLGRAHPSFDKGLKVLEEALAIGRQADPPEPVEVQIRMDAARTGKRALPRVEEPVAASDKPFFSKVKSWLTMKEMEPLA